jgi:hypothetical protein
MESVIVVLNQYRSVDELVPTLRAQGWSANWPDRVRCPNRLCVEERISDAHVFVSSVVADPTPDYPGKPLWVIDYLYKHLAFCKTLIMGIANDPCLLVDNGFGTVCPGDVFLARMRENPAWNWRDDLDFRKNRAVVDE